MKTLVRLFPWVICVMLCATSYPADGSSGYPNRYVTVIVAYAAGGGYDIQARMVAPYLKKHMPNNVDLIIRNVTGAGGRVGALELAKSKPDGYTIGFLGTGSLAVAQLMGQSSGIDITKDITWLGRTEACGWLLIMSKTGRIKSLQEIKGKQVRMMFTADAAGSVMLIKHFGGEPFTTQSSGSVELVTALMRGDIDMYFVSYSTGLKEVAASGGQLFPALILRTDKRPELPNVPNLVDVGLKLDASMWGADRLLCAPTGLPEDVEKTLTATIAKATSDPEFIAKMEKGGYMPSSATPQEAKKLVEDAVARLRENQKLWEPMLRK